jgi:hypothetical protein
MIKKLELFLAQGPKEEIGLKLGNQSLIFWSRIFFF